MNKRTQILLVFSLLSSGVALSQVFLGNMFRLGSTTTAARPASSSTIRGALLYDTDVGMPIYNNGSAWNTIGESPNYWIDAGTIDSSGGTLKGMTTTWRIGTADAGVGAVFDAPTGTGSSTAEQGIALGITGGNSSGTASYGALGFYQFGFSSKAAVLAQIYATSGTAGVSRAGINIQSRNSINFSGSDGAAGNWGMNGTVDYGSFSPSTGGLILRAANNADAIQLNTTGARVHFSSGGTNDYAVSDGTGIETPGYWESTRAFSVGAGVIANRVQATGGASSAYTASAASAAGVGTLSWNSTRGQMMTQVTSSTFGPIGQPHLVTDKQTISTRVFGGTAANAPPQIAERIVVSGAGADTLQSYWTSTAGNSTTIGSSPYRAYYALTTSTVDNNRQYWTVASSAASTTMLPITSTDASPSFCQRLNIFTAATNMRIFTGWVASLPSSATATLSVTGAVFRYDTSVATSLQLCTRDSTTQSCTSTGITVAADTEYLLCLTMDSSRNVYGWVNGVHVATQSANLPVANTRIAPYTSVENISGGVTKTLLVGVTQVEIQ